MKRLPVLIATLAALAVPALTSPVFAADDPVAVRERLMESNAAAAAVSAGIMKDEIPYNPAVGKAAIQTFAATAAAFGSFFPEGSTADSTASPKIWEDAAGWQAALGKFSAAAEAAVAASGRSGPADKAAFVAAVTPVLGTCNSCHETYRVRN